MESHQLGWQSLVQSWMNTQLPPRLTADHRNTIRVSLLLSVNVLKVLDQLLAQLQRSIVFKMYIYVLSDGITFEWEVTPPGGGGRVTATALFDVDCGTDHPSHSAFYYQRSRFLCRCRSGVEQPSALGDVISVPSRFPKTSRQFYLLAPSRHTNTFLRFILSPCFILRFFVFSIMCFSL